ncbi:phage portal protein [Clostridium sp. YIM B02551]|uniref:phage portal protein n=1 Tax=Clostridium sp. YIM B02551 TaxID=2910679 RepID=UPI001EEA5522|nr:phage portal protein [Clostridium sp. YIM B02551]
MIFRNSIKNQEASEESANWSQSFNELINFLGISENSLLLSGKNALKEVIVYTCIKILSEAIGKLPLKIYQDNEGVRKASDHYLYQLFKLRPNPYMSASDFWKCMEVLRNIHGNSYAWIDFIRTGKNAGRIQGFYPLNPEQVKVWIDDVGLLSSKNSMWYIYTDNLGNQYKLKSTDVLHFKGLSTNGLVGLSPISMLKRNIENSAAAGQFLNNSYKNGMQTAGIINYVGDLSPAAEQTFKEKFEQMSSGLKNANRISLLPIGYQYQPLALKLTDAQFLENTKLSAQQLAAAYGIKMHQINELIKTSYASTSEANREFYSDTLMAILTTYEQEILYKCFLNSEIIKGIYTKFNVDVLLRGDTKTRYESYAIAIQNGIKTPNEVRSLEEDPPKEGGDRLYMNGNYIPVEMAGKQYEKGGGNNG